MQSSAPPLITAPAKHKPEETEKGVFTMEMLECLQRIFDALGIATRPDSMPMKEALRLIEQAIAPVKEKLVDEAVAAAIAAHKLRPDEKKWALEWADEYGLAAFASFVKLRQPVSALALRLNSGAGAPAQISAAQKEMNLKLGVSDAMFAKSNGVEGGAHVSISALQASINKQVGVSPELFTKYNVAGR